jgi:hypothetical protein
MEAHGICPHCLAAGISVAAVGYTYVKNLGAVHLVRIKNWIKK